MVDVPAKHQVEDLIEPALSFDLLRMGRLPEAWIAPPETRELRELVRQNPATDDGDKRFVACYRDPDGRQCSAGTYSSRRAAERAANREEAKVREGAWHDHSRGQVTFTEYVETVWLPSKQVETSTLAAYRSYLDKHFIPVFGRRPMGKILPSEVQRWVTTATDNGLSAASVGKYHTMLSSVFERALVHVRHPQVSTGEGDLN